MGGEHAVPGRERGEAVGVSARRVRFLGMPVRAAALVSGVSKGGGCMRAPTTGKGAGSSSRARKGSLASTAAPGRTGPLRRASMSIRSVCGATTASRGARQGRGCPPGKLARTLPPHVEVLVYLTSFTARSIKCFADVRLDFPSSDSES
jgi:hypothetical protein